MKLTYKGFGIKAKKELSLGGDTLVYVTAFRLSDGWMLVDDFTYNESVSEEMDSLKQVVDDYLNNPKEWYHAGGRLTGKIVQFKRPRNRAKPFRVGSTVMARNLERCGEVKAVYRDQWGFRYTVELRDGRQEQYHHSNLRKLTFFEKVLRWSQII
jgi:hypothetical protein